MTPMKAIRAKCLDCCGDSSKEVELCTAPNCPLYPYRFGKNLSDKTREATPARLAALEKARLSRKLAAQTGGKTDAPAAEGRDTTHGDVS